MKEKIPQQELGNNQIIFEIAQNRKDAALDSRSQSDAANVLNISVYLKILEIELYRSTFMKNYKEGGLFGQMVPLLDEILDKSVLAYSEEDNLGLM